MKVTLYREGHNPDCTSLSYGGFRPTLDRPVHVQVDGLSQALIFAHYQRVSSGHFTLCH